MPARWHLYACSDGGHKADYLGTVDQRRRLLPPLPVRCGLLRDADPPPRSYS
eukprot:COSAG06_NODE_8633_length_2109_cov_5.444776_3_plen_51_part_01